jgi:hypothetical protein
MEVSLMRIAIAVLLLLSARCAQRALEPAAADEALAAREAVAQKPAPETKPLGCTILGEPTSELGNAPKVTVAITNQTKADIYLVGSLDASDCQWRYPHCYFEVTGPDGKSAVSKIARCKHMDALQEKHFVKVLPGRSFDPFQNGFFSAHQLDASTFRTAGEYRIRFVYSTNSSTIAEWTGDRGGRVAVAEKLVAMFSQVPKVEVRSNEIKITVGEPSR